MWCYHKKEVFNFQKKQLFPRIKENHLVGLELGIQNERTALKINHTEAKIESVFSPGGFHI